MKDDQAPPLSQPPPLFFCWLKISALVVYIVCGLFSKSFITNFVVVVVLLMADFWMVNREERKKMGSALENLLHRLTPRSPHLFFFQTKNVAGRLLVGLRWWNEVTDTGGSNWRFESLADGQRAVNKADSKAFWWALWAAPAAWVLLGVLALARLKVDYLLVVSIAVMLGGANVVGYTKCSKTASAALRSYAQQAVTSGLTAAIGRV
jgi:hypothetical protein